jgi:hypothetical protein
MFTSCVSRRAAVVGVVLSLVSLVVVLVPLASRGEQISDAVVHGENLLSSTGDMVPREADTGAIREVRYAVIV